MIRTDTLNAALDVTYVVDHVDHVGHVDLVVPNFRFASLTLAGASRVPANEHNCAQFPSGRHVAANPDEVGIAPHA
ncbi:hypothetical protein ACIBSV_49350 [Embleya sp. NPDC050154]|uniref:hypothetical protein n=1 Tax=Embleya sp. NPDC050154 TaxID=3363988 RepID=UPI0037A7EDB0